MYGIRDTANTGTPGGAWLKFITDRFPSGLWSGLSSARKYQYRYDADEALRTIIRVASAESPTMKTVKWLSGLEVQKLPE